MAYDQTAGAIVRPSKGRASVGPNTVGQATFHSGAAGTIARLFKVPIAGGPVSLGAHS